MGQPLVTVLMPVYNGEKFLREAIDSILQQTFTSFEFLIIDDGSTDSSAEIINSYKDYRIRLIRNEQNLGISATLNKGIQLASAELIARMDSDDISYPERLQKQYNFFTSHNDCVFVSCWAQVVTEDRVPVKTEKYNSRYYYYNMTFSCWMYHPTVMYKRSAVLHAGAYQSRYAEDYDLFWQIMRRYKIYNIEEVLLDYRVTGQSLHQVVKKKEYDEAMAAQILRNMRFYAGNDFAVSEEEMACLRFDFAPVMESKNFGAVISSFRKLKMITDGMLRTDNHNCDGKSIKEAYFFRKRYMKNYFLKNLPFLQSLYLRILLKFL